MSKLMKYRKKTMKKINIIIIVLIISTFGCAITPPIDPLEPQRLISLTTTTYDSYNKRTTYRGPYYYIRSQTYSNDLIFLRAWKDGDSISYQIYVRDFYYNEWRFYDRVYDSNNTELSITLIDQDVTSCSGGSCTFCEDIGINVSKDYLEINKKTGIKFKIYGKGGSQEFYLPGILIETFLSVVK